MAAGLVGLAVVAFAIADVTSVVLCGAGAYWLWMRAAPTMGEAELRRRLAGVRVDDALIAEPILMSGDMTPQEARVVFEAHEVIPYLPAVEVDGRYLGLLRWSALDAAIPEGSPTRVRDLVTPIRVDGTALCVPEGTPLVDVLRFPRLFIDGCVVVVDAAGRHVGCLLSVNVWRAAGRRYDGGPLLGAPARRVAAVNRGNGRPGT